MLTGFAEGLVIQNVVALVTEIVVGKSMSWFVNVFSATLLYGVPALLGTSISYFFVRLTNPPPSDSSSRSVLSSLSVD